MTKRTLSLVLAAVLLAAALSGCGPAKAVSSGAFESNAYANDYFSLSFSLPSSWVSYSKAEMLDVLQVDAASIGSDDKEAEKKMDLAKQDLLYLAYATNHAADYTQGNIISFVLMAEKFNTVSNLIVGSGKEYAEYLIKNNKDTNPVFAGCVVTTETINGVEYGVVETVVPGADGDMKQVYYCAVKNGYALAFLLTYFEDEERDEYRPILDSITFK